MAQGRQDDSNMEDVKSKLFLLEKKTLHLQRHMERSGTQSLGSRSDLKVEIDSDKMVTMEKRIGRKVAESVDQLGAIMKDYAQKQTRLMGRVNDIEVRVFGASKVKAEPKRDLSARDSKRSLSPPVKDG